MNTSSSRTASDAEFVEKIRKQLLSARRQGWLLLLFSMCHLGAIAFICGMVAKYKIFHLGFAAGCFVGFFVGFAIVMSLMYFALFIEHFFGLRKDKLLVAYYDQARQLNQPAAASIAEKSPH